MYSISAWLNVVPSRVHTYSTAAGSVSQRNAPSRSSAGAPVSPSACDHGSSQGWGRQGSLPWSADADELRLCAARCTLRNTHSWSSGGNNRSETQTVISNTNQFYRACNRCQSQSITCPSLSRLGWYSILDGSGQDLNFRLFNFCN